MYRFAALAIAVALCSVGSVARADHYSYQSISNPYNPRDTHLTGINDLGVIVGEDAGSGVEESFLLSSGKYSPISNPLGDSTFAEGINNAGAIVGFSRSILSVVDSGFVLVGGNYTPIIDPYGRDGTDAIGINNLGEVVGQYNSSADRTGESPNGFLFSDGVYTDIDVPSATGTSARGINDLGQIVGVFGPRSEGFLLSGGVYSVISAPYANAIIDSISINDAGLIVGTYIVGGGAHTFVYENGVFTTLDPFGSSQNVANDVNNLGQIVGSYNTDTSAEGFLATPNLTPTPEPATWAMLALGAGALGATLRRRRGAALARIAT